MRQRGIFLDETSGEILMLNHTISAFIKTMTRLPLILLTIGWFMIHGSAAEIPDWEARIPHGAETDPIALNTALGVKEILNRPTVERLRSLKAFGIQPHAFRNLVPKVAGIGVFKVSVRRDSGEWVPSDMGGIGPFYLLKSGTNYCALTQGNFVRTFAPLTNRSEVLPYLTAYESLNGLAPEEVVTAGKRGGPKPPKFTEVQAVENGFRATLVYHLTEHTEAFYEKTVEVGRDGVVKEISPLMMLKYIGQGPVQ